MKESLRGKMYRSRQNYIRFGQRHIFINFTEENLDDLKAIDVSYGRGPRSKSGRVIWSGEIHIFIDQVVKSSPTNMGTFQVLQLAKAAYGDIFKIHVHLYPPIVYTNKRNRADVLFSYKDDFDKLIHEKGAIHVMKHKRFIPVSFEDGFTEITIRRCYSGDVPVPTLMDAGKPYVHLEVTTTVLRNIRGDSCRHYETFNHGPI